MQLLFFDTFSHENSDDFNLDLVQFPTAVQVTEVRVIPLGTRVQANFPGGVRLGATNPSQFHVDFFVNDLSKKDPPTFDQFGSLDYKHNVEIQVVSTTKIPTDGLLLRGHYTTITLAIFGHIIRERTLTPPLPVPVATPVPSKIKPVQTLAADNINAKGDNPPKTLESEKPAEVVVLSSNEPTQPQPKTSSSPAQQPIPSVVETKSTPSSDSSLNQIVSIVAGRSSRDNNAIIVHSPTYSSTTTATRDTSALPNRREENKTSLSSSSSSSSSATTSEVSRNARDRDAKRERSREQSSRREREPDRTSERERDRGGSGSGRNRDRAVREPPPINETDRDSRNVRILPIQQERVSHTPPPPPQPSSTLSRSRPPSPKGRRPRTPTSPHPSEVLVETRRKPSTPPLPIIQLEEESVDDKAYSSAPPVVSIGPQGQGQGQGEGELFEPLTPDTSPTEPVASTETFSEGETQEPGYPDYYEEIVSEEEEMSESESNSDRILEFPGELDYDVIGDEAYVTTFNPFQCELVTLQHFPDPSWSPFEIEANKQKPITDKSEVSNSSYTVSENVPPLGNQSYDRLRNLLLHEGRNISPEKWVEAIEVVTALLIPAASELALSITSNDGDSENVVDGLVDWCCDALDFELALQQPLAVFKVRQLKAGIKLAMALFAANRDIVLKLLRRGVQMKLLNLYTKEYMALSLKLLIIKALDLSTRFKEGMLALVKGFEDDVDKEDKNRPERANKQDTGYQQLLDIFLAKQPTRATVAITALLNKIHFFEMLHKFTEATENIANLMSSIMPDPPAPIEPITKCLSTELVGNLNEDTDSQPMVATPATMVTIPRELLSDQKSQELREIVSCLQEIYLVLSTAERSIAQPRRSLPVKAQFVIHKDSQDNPYPHLYSLLNDSHFIESLMLLCSFPLMTLQPALLSIIRDMLDELLSSQHGMLYLLSHTTICNSMLRILLQDGGGSSNSGGGGRSGGVGGNGSVGGIIEMSEECHPLSQICLQALHSLQAIQCVDSLLSEVRDAACLCRKEIDDPDILSNLHALYTMTFTPAGRSAVVNVLAAELNLEAVLPFLQPTGNEELDMKLRKSACIGYATELLLMTIRQSENIHLLENFSEKLLSICKEELTSKVQELALWLTPLTGKLRDIAGGGYSYQALPHLCSIVVASVEDVVACPGELITALRILQHLSIPPSTKAVHSGCEHNEEELKYKYVIVQLFANDMLATFITILQKLCDAHEYPTLHAPSFVGQRGALLLAIIKPIIAMIRRILGYLIHCRGVEFKDLTSIKTLLSVYTLLSSFTPASPSNSVHQKVLMDIVDTLLVFTQPELDPVDSEESLNNSLWTKMVREVFAYTLTSPNVFTSGLSIISELLPLPLPIHSQEILPPDQINKAISFRKLWSAHLHSLSSLIQDVVTTLGGTSDQTLQQLVRRICIQLADLSAPTALVIVRGLLDAVLDGLAMIEDSTRDNFHFGHLSRLLNLLAVLMSNACVKASLLHLIRGTTKLDLKYGELLPKLAKNLNSPPLILPVVIAQKASVASDKSYSFNFQQTQECIASIFQSVCDDEITLIPLDSQLAHLEQIANSLPAKDQLSIICASILDHLCEGPFNNSPSFIISLRTLVMLTEHDYGFYYLKSCLDERLSIAPLHLILASICSNFNRTNPDLMSGLSTFLELIRLLVSLEGEGPHRTLELAPCELASYLNWENTFDKNSKGDEEEGSNVVEVAEKSSLVESDAIVDKEPSKDVPLHPLLQLTKLLGQSESNREEESLESQTLENVHWVLQFLREKTKEQLASAPEKEWPEVVLPPAESLLHQFSIRMTTLVGDVDEEALNSSFWLPQSGDDSDQESEQVSCNLKAMADEFCPGLDFGAVLGKMFLAKDDAVNDKERKASSLTKRRYQALINPGNKEPPKKKPFIAPMRGRGGYARGMIHTSRANDPFRSRPPNTSRPPSMHVDDFVAMEIFQPSSSSSTGQSSKRNSKESNRGRGRASFESNPRDFVTTRGRFFPGTSTAGYTRRDERGRGSSRVSTTGSNTWTRDGASPGQHASSPSSSSKLKFSSMAARSYVRAGHTEPRSEPRVQASRLTDPSAGRFSHVDRGVSSGSGSSSSSLGLWPPGIRNKERDSRFPGTCTQARGRRDTNRHARAFTR